MQISIIYFSKTGNTAQMAEIVAQGIRKIEGTDVRCFTLDAIDYDYVGRSAAVLFGSPTYLANTCWQLKRWLDESSARANLSGKLGGVFITANYAARMWRRLP